MANQYFDPYYLSWDDGTYGKVNISDAEAAATERARRFHAQSLTAETGIFSDERPQSDWQKRAQAFLDKNKGPRPEEITGDLADRPFENGNQLKRRALPALLQPGKVKLRLNADIARYGQIDASLQGLLKEFTDSPEWRQAELQAPYARLKGQADESRVTLVKTKANLANATQLATRDSELLKLAKEDADFDSNWKTVRRLYGDFETGVQSGPRPLHMIDAEIGVTRAMLGFYELDGLVNQELDEKQKLEYKPLKEQLAKLEEEKTRLIKSVEKTTIGSKEYRSAHVNASNTLVDKGLNVKGFKLAGRLLAITPYDELKSLVNAARTGGVVDAEGNFPSPEEILEEQVNNMYDPLLRYLVEDPEERAKRAAEVEASVAKTRAWRQEEEEKEAKVKAAEANEKRIKTRIEISNDKLIRKQVDY
jgi:hypothetical protein